MVRGRPVSDPISSSASRDTADLVPHLEKRQSRKGKNKAASSRETSRLVAKLNSAARDLSEVFDGYLPSDVEMRYNAGELHVYTHRLYKARGRQMFERVKSDYRSERLMRGRIDAYIRLFERLLDTVSGAANADEMIDACLTSESGKLYLLFAQATGRIET